MLLASPDGTVYFMSEQARPDFYTTELRLWSSGDFGAGPWTERYFDAKDPAQKYSLGGAVDPTDPSRVVMTFNCGTTYFYALKTSTGAEGPWTKTDMGSHNSAGGFGGVLLYGPGGRLYHVSARFAQVGNTGAVHVRRSNDHGDTWELALSHEHPESVFAHGQGAIDPNDPTGDSFVYAAAFANSGNIHLFRSTDGARTMHTLQTSLGEGNADQHYPGARFDNSGQLVVSWVTFDGRLQAAQSSDRGGTFGTPVEIAAGDVSAAYIEPLAGTCDFLALTQTGRLNGPIALQVF
ncbi:MAG TPA: hypothetical protein VEI97_11225 [bacterium]|nr:hypothetical protein [bacterium]